MNDLRTYYAGYRLRLIILEQARLEMRARHWIKGDHGYFAGSYSTGGGAGTKKTVDKAGESGIIDLKDSLDVYSPVTQESIDKVPKTSSFDDENLNALHQQAAKDLLSEVKRREDVPVGTEFSVRYDKNMKLLSDETYRKGEVGSVKVNDPGVPFHVFHNHGSCETLSVSDAQVFTDITNAMSITAVGNNGSIFCLTRTENCDTSAFSSFLSIKSKAVIFSANGFDYSLRKLYDESMKKIVDAAIKELSPEQKNELNRAVRAQTTKCLKGGAKFGFKYTETSRLAD